MMSNKHLDVYYHGKLVGTLAETPDKRVAFQYSTTWQKTGFSINPFLLPLKNDVFIPPEKNREIFGGLFGTFADSLPDAWGNLLMKRYFSSVGIDSGSLSPLDKLAYIGNSGIGALEYYPNKVADFNIEGSDLDYDSLASECNIILSSKESDKLSLLYNLAGSSGGTRPKIQLCEGETYWIIKFPSRNDPKNIGKCEYDYSVCAKKCGIPMTNTFLVPSNYCSGYFKTERFDRKNGEKIFTSTFSALLNVDHNSPSCDYKTFMKLIQVLTKDNRSDKEQMFRQMCFNIFAHNKDDHTKNFSFIFTEDNGWRLSPAYDITYSNTYYGEHTTSVNKKGKDITNEDLSNVGEFAKLSKEFIANTIIDTSENVKVLAKYIDSKNKFKAKKSLQIKGLKN